MGIPPIDEMRLLSSVIFVGLVQSALLADVSFDQQINNARQEILSGAYADAVRSISQAKNDVATIRAMPRDYTAIKTTGLTTAGVATSEIALNALSDALTKHSQNDTKGTVQALNLAQIPSDSLLIRQAPSQRLAFSQAAVQRVIGAQISDRGLDPYLHGAAKSARAPGQYRVSLGYVEQILTLVRTGPAS